MSDPVAYRCPVSGEPLALLAEGGYHSPSGRVYPLVDGIPDFAAQGELSPLMQEELAYYEANAERYDDVEQLTFRIQKADEHAVRERFVDALNLRPESRVLDATCGTGLDAQHLLRRLGADGFLQLQDLSQAMLRVCRAKFADDSRVRVCRADAGHLPYPDRSFDGVLSFGGANVFDDLAGALREMVRVTKVGGRVVFGDESMPPWLKDTEFGRILSHNNRLFAHPLPLAALPVEARDVVIRYVIGGVYYLIEFTVGEGEPEADFDLPIPGMRGGTLRTRYHGRLEGVTPEAKRMAIAAAASSGMSLHDWLDRAVRAAAGAEDSTGRS